MPEPLPEPWIRRRQQAHCFPDRVRFLYENGYNILAEQAEVIAVMLSLADQTLDETGYAAWLREPTAPK